MHSPKNLPILIFAFTLSTTLLQTHVANSDDKNRYAALAISETNRAYGFLSINPVKEKQR